MAILATPQKPYLASQKLSSRNVSGNRTESEAGYTRRGWLQAVPRGVAVAKDMRPVAVVEDQGFTHLINTLESYLVKKNTTALLFEMQSKI